jgi:chlorobactene glucosyltransferase
MTSHPQPAVSAIIPARNEELNIARSVRSIAAQPEILEIIVVDDQSEDRTGEILKELQEELPALRVVRLDDLPWGWAGKPHALAAGAQVAVADWLLFSDADTVHRPGSLGALLAYAKTQGADLLSISPGQKLAAWWEKSVIPVVFVQLAALYPFEKVSNPRSPVAAANGQYILIRRASYESVGGHAAAPDAVLEDVDLARRVKSTGGRLIFLAGAQWAETRMYRTFAEMWTGWTKNLFLLYRCDVDEIQKAILNLWAYWIPGFTLVLGSILLVGFVLLRAGRGRPWRHFLWLAILSWLAMLTPLAAQQRRYRRSLRRAGFSARLAKYVFLGAPLLSLILLNSVRVYRRRGLVQWKGRIYSVGQPQ